MKTLLTAKRVVEFPIRYIKEDGEKYLCKSDILSFLGITRYPYTEEITDILKSIDKKDTTNSEISLGDKSYKYSFIKRKAVLGLLKVLKGVSDDKIVEYSKSLYKQLKE